MPVIFKAKTEPFTTYGHLAEAKHQLFHSFCVRPFTRFETQADNETVVLILRAHPVTQVAWIIASLIIFVLPLFFNVLLINYLPILKIIFINLFWYAFLFSFVFLNILNYVFNVGIVTNRRVIDVDFTNILYKEVTEALNDKIEDTTVKSAGFIASLFNYGNLFVQTAGTELNIEFINIPKPTESAAIINGLLKTTSGPKPIS